MSLAAALVIAYVLGSFPSAYLAGRLVKGIDLRTVGSGNLGATNVYRQVGLVAAIVVLALDAGKGWVAVSRLPQWMHLGGNPWFPIALGAAAIVGHAKPIFLLGRGGGKGVATGAGVFLALAPAALGVAAAVFAIVVAATRYMSLASLCAALLLPIAVVVTSSAQTPAFIAAAVIAAFILWSHRANIKRLRAGTEPKLGRPGVTG